MTSASLKFLSKKFYSVLDSVSDGDYDKVKSLEAFSLEELEKFDLTQLVNEDERDNKQIVNWLIDVKSEWKPQLVDELINVYARRMNIVEKDHLIGGTKFDDDELKYFHHMVRGANGNPNYTFEVRREDMPKNTISAFDTSDINREVKQTFDASNVIKSDPPLARGTYGSAGHDLPSSIDIVVPAHLSAVIDTGVTIKLNPGFHAEVKSRSGLQFRNNVNVFNGVIDSDYKDTIKVCLFNNGDADYEVKKGERIAQLVVYKHYTFDNSYVIDTSGNHAGFGSTGN